MTRHHSQSHSRSRSRSHPHHHSSSRSHSGQHVRTKKQQYDLIGELPLLENVGGGRSKNLSVSVLQGVLRVERAADRHKSFRIVAAFRLQVKIHEFEKGYFKTCDKLFDFISLRYLYEEGERHEVLPNGDALTTDVEVTEESSKSGSANVGLSGTAPMPTITPSLSVQVGREKKLTVTRNVNSWRRGLSYEAWYHKRAKPLEHHGEYHGKPTTQRHHGWKRAFQVQSQHRIHPNCGCPQENFDPETCELRQGDTYSRCAHWFWQVQAQPHLWAPEIYESVTFLITVTRIASPQDIDFSSEKAQRYFHFDFVLQGRLRELGWSVRDHLYPLYPWRPRKPAEIRAKDDFGYPLGVEKIKFCIRACPEGITWPDRPTPNLQEDAHKKVFKKHAITTSLVSKSGSGSSSQGCHCGDHGRQADCSHWDRRFQHLESGIRRLESQNARNDVRRKLMALGDALSLTPVRHHRHGHHGHHHHHHHHHGWHNSDAASDSDRLDDDRGRPRERIPHFMSGVRMPRATQNNRTSAESSPEPRGYSVIRDLSISSDSSWVSIHRCSGLRTQSTTASSSSADNEPGMWKANVKKHFQILQDTLRDQSLEARREEERVEFERAMWERSRWRHRHHHHSRTGWKERKGSISPPVVKQTFRPGQGVVPLEPGESIDLADPRDPARTQQPHRHHRPTARRRSGTSANARYTVLGYMSGARCPDSGRPH
ncbi:hypothetical protein B0T16DRAFT_407525 [Cercophora newfieldiana]|uniref:Uncharacterized protein n=1 Tax=Cercophora newfieldiana TaxID=92897 RepID=A0AA39YKF6_9PEZI|nr:hypothetical protein B0T16DRAFT_407525 [Cercophora newfieldiana]